MKSNLFLLTLTLAAVAASPALAQHDHGDIEYGYEGGELVVEGGPLFEGDFGDAEFGLDVTDAPGWENAEHEGLTIGGLEFLAYHVTRPLVYHDGTSFAPTSATLTVESAGTAFADVDVTSAGASGIGLVGQADAAGDLHTHTHFSISTTAPIGAYGLYLQLATYIDDNGSLVRTAVPESDEFLIVFNRGLSETAFEAAAEGAFAATIPEPSAALLLAMGLAFAARRRK